MLGVNVLHSLQSLFHGVLALGEDVSILEEVSLSLICARKAKHGRNPLLKMEGHQEGTNNNPQRKEGRGKLTEIMLVLTPLAVSVSISLVTSLLGCFSNLRA